MGGGFKCLFFITSTLYRPHPQSASARQKHVLHKKNVPGGNFNLCYVIIIIIKYYLLKDDLIYRLALQVNNNFIDLQD